MIMIIGFLMLISITQNVSFVGIVFITVYKFLPDAKMAWKDVLSDACLSTILFMIGKYLFGFHAEKTCIGIAYGAAGSLVFLLIWVCYSSIILLFGAEFLEVYTRRKNRTIKPESSSVKIIGFEVIE